MDLQWGNAQQYYKAANHKGVEAMLLLQNDHLIGGSYLIGYVVEMVLKAAICEIGGELFDGDFKRRLQKIGENGHGLYDLYVAFQKLVTFLDIPEYRELLDRIDPRALKELSEWGPDWRYHESITVFEDTDFHTKLIEQVCEITNHIRFILQDHQGRRV